MANQTITTSTNHDALTGRAAGEDITIQQGAKLTIDSMPHLTPMGILGDILLTKGEVHIDGTKVRETTYSSDGGGTAPTASQIADAVWDEAVVEHANTGSTGEALADAGGAGNPWSSAISTNNDPGTFGELVQKDVKQKLIPMPGLILGA